MKQLQFKLGDLVLFKNKIYLVNSLMDHPRSNWSYGLKPLDSNHFEDYKTVFDTDVHLLKLHREFQISIFDLLGELS
jgi:hypothetical protein